MSTIDNEVYHIWTIFRWCTTLRYKTFPVQCEKNNEAGNSLNAVVREPVPTRVLNPKASEAIYKTKQRSYRRHVVSAPPPSKVKIS